MVKIAILFLSVCFFGFEASNEVAGIGLKFRLSGPKLDV